MPSASVRPLRAEGRGGFTLIEVVVAVAILASALVWSMTAHATELRTLTTARSVNVAVVLAEDRVAAIELFAKGRLPSLPDSLEDGRFPAPFEEMTWEADAQSVLDTEFVEVAVSIQWDGGSHTLTKLVGPVTGRVQ